MWPWGHLAVGYLCYSVFTRWRFRQPPQHRPALVLAVATQLPDLIDKPLAYWSQIIPSGRSLAHSLLIVVPLWILVWRISTRYDARRIGTAFFVGYLTHLLGDSYGALLTSQFDRASFLLWPILPAPEYTTTSFGQHWIQLLTRVRTITVQGFLSGDLPMVAYQGLLAGFVAVLWVIDGTPGIDPLLDRIRDHLRDAA
ncbi:metal-dependent hydrolase [Halobellus sp. GM3]|uniref:metal-dependent hydrolase n=1 Tax=Halobellus sp. GM3 TaxID=3458410 RepID=UPI00403E10E4